MADPISSTSPNPEPNACIDETSDASALCTAPAQPPVVAPPSMSEEPAVCTVPSAVNNLVQQFSPSAVAKAVVSALPAHTIMIASTSSGPSAAGGSYRVGASLLKAQIDSGPLQGTGMELGSVSVQYGTDADVQATVGRETYAMSHAGYGLSLTGEGLAARANLGEHNDDGSLGGNIGAGAELGGAELTLSTPANSLTAGISVSASLSGSIGVRDADHDGKPEFCAKFSVPAFTLGACLEQFW